MSENTPNNKKTLILIAIPLVLLIIGGYLIVRKNPRLKSLTEGSNQASGVKKSINTNQNNASNTPGAPQTVNDEANLNQNSSGESLPEEKQSSEKTDESLRQQIISYVNQNLIKLVPSPKNDEWDTPSFYFVGNSKLYLELYAVDTDLAGVEILYDVTKTGSTFKLTELARYKEGEEDWVLLSGKDEFSDFVMDDYEYNEQKKVWERIDELTDETSDGSLVNPESDEADTNSLLP